MGAGLRTARATAAGDSQLVALPAKHRCNHSAAFEKVAQPVLDIRDSKKIYVVCTYVYFEAPIVLTKSAAVYEIDRIVWQSA